MSLVSFFGLKSILSNLSMAALLAFGCNLLGVSFYMPLFLTCWIRGLLSHRLVGVGDGGWEGVGDGGWEELGLAFLCHVWCCQVYGCPHCTGVAWCV